jgi:hypothetical protein
MTAQLDTRAAKLELLLNEADQRIQQLRGSTNRPSSEAQDQQPIDGVIVEARAPASNSMPEAKLDPRHVQVYELADGGHPPQEIARLLGRPSGEVELILALRDTPNG